jgi:hypothetical protein
MNLNEKQRAQKEKREKSIIRKKKRTQTYYLITAGVCSLMVIGLLWRILS